MRRFDALFLALATAGLLTLSGCGKKEAPPSTTADGPADSAPQPVPTPTGPTSTGAAGSPSDTGTAGATGTGPTGGSADAATGTGQERGAQGTPPADSPGGARGDTRRADAGAGTTMDRSTAAPAASGAGAGADSPRANPARNNLLTGGVSDTATPAPSPATTDPSALALEDQNFMTTAASSALYQIDAARAAGERAGSAEVKRYAATLLKDHTAALDELRALAARKKVALASEVPAGRRPALDQLLKAKGTEFDRGFVQTVGIDNHKTDIGLFEKTAAGAKDAEVKAYAAKMLPALREHLAAAQKLPRASGG
ncbi:DUF4142 domain-containing protein [Aquabacterium sp. A7-Y]|uniref:DUF4142 domain-containing protein n=1 Tax=Aquabacterium sp. A7-Y TaxID=1349605 RepID=UPI00223DEB5B|nr:DUF4142 domain-containing protein [Aquabacterium sp. A7-Y]MCW7536321.1 DUF4142 domain-containing protein [Aquabacterium sp. A7-Y]